MPTKLMLSKKWLPGMTLEDKGFVKLQLN